MVKAKKILYWLSSNLEWKPTDYARRTVKEIIARGGGNCFEMASVYSAIIKAAGIKYRSIAEVMIYPVSARRLANASRLIREKGNRLSVFGVQHNDHRWVEVYDSENKNWEPADATMGVIGMADWLKARMSFGLRMTMDTAKSNEMINSLAIFVTNNNKDPEESRTAYYLIEKFDEFYKNRLSKLPEWNDWTTSINNLTEHCRNAFLGKENLHLYQDEIYEAAEAYQKL